MKLKLLILTTLITFNVTAATVPLSQGFDRRVQTTKYNPKDVVKITTKIGRATLIQLQDGETIMSKDLSGVGMGDATAWGLAIRGNNIFLKPQAVNPDTNLLIVSDKNRTYSFDLVTVDNKLNSAYVVRFDYEKPKEIVRPGKTIPCSDGVRNFSYVKWGDNFLSPQFVWDDGRFTCFKFAKNVEQPVIYQKTFTGKETLINTHMQNDVLVAHGVSPEFRLRLGEAVLGIKATELSPQGYNEKATSIDAQRTIIKE
ncbi:P-type conjugative transfer protein VirB9 [Shewanella sairae]|uniref:P-type conjugative transfer protein VirB9 n=1 Tax=Shewanella sairae TaxID=190310 RepID=A0ABQ4PLK9_9GAMM|nr:TrbG/VirB9 family P-type conjugative transfer protein [Shewanella sairae]MCL1131889.1 TrbG/VirB9 family P-type conjugative transfer protein [Shewanella sairae]GIU48860.1 P-type conjugative transfer protein VirB9 [Shewanella sairae]